jgi:hypothetical protein
MFAVIENGSVARVIPPDVTFSVNGKEYSHRFIRNSTPEERKAAGVYEIIYDQEPDQRFYWVDGPTYTVVEIDKNVRATYSSRPKLLEDRPEVKEDGTPLYVQTYDPAANNGQGAMVDTTEQVVTKGLKSQWIAQTKAAANSELAQTDWMVIRKAERNVDIPADVQDYRVGVLVKCAEKEAAIAACTTVEQLMVAVQG